MGALTLRSAGSFTRETTKPISQVLDALVATVKLKTQSRTVLGYLNEMVRFSEYPVGDARGLARCNVGELNRELRRELHLSRHAPGYFVPIELAGG